MAEIKEEKKVEEINVAEIKKKRKKVSEDLLTITPEIVKTIMELKAAGMRSKKIMKTVGITSGQYYRITRRSHSDLWRSAGKKYEEVKTNNALRIFGDNEELLTKADKIKVLEDIIKDPRSDPTLKISAINNHSKLTNDELADSVTRIEFVEYESYYAKEKLLNPTMKPASDIMNPIEYNPAMNNPPEIDLKTEVIEAMNKKQRAKVERKELTEKMKKDIAEFENNLKENVVQNTVEEKEEDWLFNPPEEI
jgi:hypothetical protein